MASATATITIAECTEGNLQHVATTSTTLGNIEDVSRATSDRLSTDIIEPAQLTETSNFAEFEIAHPTGTKFWFPIRSAALVLILGGLDNNIVATAVPSITDHFNTSADVGWYSAAFRLTLCAFQFMFGKLYKLFSVKHVFMTTICIFLAGSTICATAISSRMFVLGRAVVGLAEAGVVAGVFTLVVQMLPLRKRPVFNGTLAAIEAVAEVSAPILGGILTENLGWRWCFWINLPLCGIALIVTGFFFTNPRPSESRDLTWKATLRQLDILGNVVFVPSLACLFLALSWAGIKYPWDDPKIISLFVAFALLLGAFIYDQCRHGDSATLPPRLFKSRSVLAGCLYSMCTNSFLNVFVYYIPLYYQAVRGYSPAKSGYMMLPVVLGALIAMLMHGAGTSMFGYYTPFMLFASVLMPIAGGLMTTWQVDTSFAKLVIFSGLVGFGAGIGFQGPQSAVQASLPTSDAPLGLSVILFAQHFGPAVSVVIAQTIFSNQLSANLEGLLPGLDAGNIEKMGLTELKQSAGLTGEKLTELLAGVDMSLIQTWYLVVALACVTMVGSLLTEWRSVKVKTN